MRLLEVTHRYEPRVGGVESHVGELSRRLAGRGHEVVVLTADRRPGEPEEEVVDGVAVRRRGSFAPGGKLHLNTGFIGAADGAWDAVHVHNYHSAPAVLAALGDRYAKLVFTPHYHGAGSTRLTNALLAPWSVLGGRALRSADEVIAVSEWEADRLREDHRVDPVVVPHGLDYGAMEGERQLDLRRDFALLVGRLEAYKRPVHAVRALEHTDLDLVIVGEGPMEGRIRDEAECLGVENRVMLPGRLPGDELHGLMRSASVGLNISSTEAFGMTVGEMLARGAPVVVTRDMALSDWEGTDGVLVSPSPEPELLGNMMEVATMHEPDTRPLPDWEEVADEHEEILFR